ncbi:MAG TPA: tetratricopeptide repeat protein [Pyrinomonadaceae bacterium]|nr:tetratricopeptide repeat protein [Pyrinomonadaceae bacterium]
MPTFYDSQGNSYTLNQQIGRGGEGTVFFCPNDLSLVAKIYHESIDEEKAEKLRWMAENQNDQLLKVAAWIVDVLTDENDEIVGFLMPNVKAKEIHELYSLKSRRVHFPEATWHFLIHAAANVARAFYVLHKNEHIMGDVNHGNLVVLADGTVKLIDCDSYSIKKGETRYVCDVGVATHLAPELQGLDLGEIEREKKHDNFGLAVIIFQLLFLGRHPFAGNYLGAEDKSLEDCIRERRFAYGNQETTNVKQPPGTLSLTQITPRLSAMFERAFFSEERPEPHEWIEALEDLSASLKTCSVHIGHHYLNELFACPWCEIESKTGLMLFPFVSSVKSNAENGFNIFTVENLLASLEIPQNLPAKPFKPTILPMPSEKAREMQSTNKNRLVGVAIVQFLAVFLLTIIGGAGVGFIFGVIFMTIFFAVFHSSDKPEREAFEEELRKVRQEWDELDSDWKRNNKAEELNADLALVRTKVAAHQSLQQQSRDEMKLIGEKTFQYNLDLYLASFHLTDAKIQGIEKEHFDLLAHFGLNTAVDVTEESLNVIPPIVGNVKEKILLWRKTLEQSFVLPPQTALPEADKNRFALQFTERRARLERDIEQILVSLRSGSLSLKQYQNQMIAKSENLAQRLLQAESNISVMGNSAAMLIILFLTTAVIPLFGVAFQSNAGHNYRNNYPLSTTTNSVTKSKGNSSNSAMNVYANAPDFPVKENLTDEQISQMTDYERIQSALTLYRQGKTLMEESDFQKAEKKLRYAVRFNKKDVEILNALGETLYQRKKYAESLEILKKSLEFDKKNETTKLLIGSNYLKMEKYSEAISMFDEVIIADKDLSEANYNLGLAFKGQKKYQDAVRYFSRAAELEEYEADAHYQLGFCYYKTGDKDGVQTQYEILLDLDETQAEKLRKLAGLKRIERKHEPIILQKEGVGIGSGDGSGKVYKTPKPID